jgi:hypothetical protein
MPHSATSAAQGSKRLASIAVNPIGMELGSVEIVAKP